MKRSEQFGNKPFWVNKLNGKRIDATDERFLNPDDWGYWHSELEFKVYQQLRGQLPAHCITRQAKVIVLPASSHFPAITWTCDFRLEYKSTMGCEVIQFVEAKGRWILNDSEARTSFYRLMACFAHYNPVMFNELKLVSDSAFGIRGNLMVHKLDSLNTWLKPIGDQREE